MRSSDKSLTPCSFTQNLELPTHAHAGKPDQWIQFLTQTVNSVIVNNKACTRALSAQNVCAEVSPASRLSSLCHVYIAFNRAKKFSALCRPHAPDILQTCVHTCLLYANRFEFPALPLQTMTLSIAPLNHPWPGSL